MQTSLASWCHIRSDMGFQSIRRTRQPTAKHSFRPIMS